MCANKCFIAFGGERPTRGYPGFQASVIIFTSVCRMFNVWRLLTMAGREAEKIGLRSVLARHGKALTSCVSPRLFSSLSREMLTFSRLNEHNNYLVPGSFYSDHLTNRQTIWHK